MVEASPHTGANTVEVPSKGSQGSRPLVPLQHPRPAQGSALGLGWGLGGSSSQPSFVRGPQALEEMKGDDVIAVEKSLESEAWAQLWTLRITVSVRPGVGGRGRGEGPPVPTREDWEGPFRLVQLRRRPLGTRPRHF